MAGSIMAREWAHSAERGNNELWHLALTFLTSGLAITSWLHSERWHILVVCHFVFFFMFSRVVEPLGLFYADTFRCLIISLFKPSPSTVGCWISEMLAVWNELIAVVDDVLWSMLLTATVHSRTWTTSLPLTADFLCFCSKILINYLCGKTAAVRF